MPVIRISVSFIGSTAKRKPTRAQDYASAGFSYWAAQADHTDGSMTAGHFIYDQVVAAIENTRAGKS